MKQLKRRQKYFIATRALAGNELFGNLYSEYNYVFHLFSGNALLAEENQNKITPWYCGISAFLSTSIDSISSSIGCL